MTTDPVRYDAKDNAAITLVDKFLKMHEESPVVTVANTIFPQALYEAHGSPEFYKVYHRDFDRFSRDARGWGQYFDRMSRWKVAGGTGQSNVVTRTYPVTESSRKPTGTAESSADFARITRRSTSTEPRTEHLTV